MNICIPEDFSKTCDQLTEYQKNIQSKIEGVLKSVIPLGYTLEKNSYGNINVFLTKVEDSSYRGMTLSCDSLLTSSGGTLFLQDAMTAQHVFDLCPLMQVLKSINLTALPILKIVGEK